MEKRAFYDPLVDWIHKGSDGDWSPSHPSDAQRESIVAVVGFLFVILILWNGKCPYPWKSTRVFRNKKTGGFRTVRYRKSLPIPILWPFKILTVLYHELSHAVVGMITIWWKEMREGVPRDGQRGRIDFIMVDKYEGGLTQFGGDVRPHYGLTLPAGYVGSCLFGCWFMFTGFDAKWSKYGAVSLFVLTALATIICAFVKAKWAIVHHWHSVGAWFYRWVLCSKKKARAKKIKHEDARAERNEKANYRHEEEDPEEEDPDGPTEHDLHTSQDIIMGCSLFVGVILFVAWNWDDSIWLRFVMLFMGEMSALYAVWDIILDGIKYAKVAKSDATCMAEVHNERAERHNRKHPRSPKRLRSTQFYASMWLTGKLIIIILVLIGAYFCFRKTKAEQAIESREFLPAQSPYGPADLKDDASGVSDTVKGWIGDDDPNERVNVYPSGASNAGGSVIGPGPVTAAASAIIPPAPGGIAGPHRAIPALPDAGYTATGMRPLSIDSRGPGSMYGSSSSSYSYASPRSAYGFDPQDHPGQYAAHVHSPLSAMQQKEGWATSSLPAPRRGPAPPVESIIAPKHHHHHHHHHDIDDGGSDASYYAMPKQHRSRSRSGSVSEISDGEGAREPQGHHRSRSIGHGHAHKHNRSPSLPPGNVRLHSPISPSPLAAGKGNGAPPSAMGRSPLSPSESVPARRYRMSPAPDEGTPREGGRQRLHSYVPPDSDEAERERERERDARERERDQREKERDERERERDRERSRERGRRPSAAAEADPPRPGMLRRHSSQLPPHAHSHSRHRSGFFLPPPSDYSDRQPSPPPGMIGGPASMHGGMGMLQPPDMGMGGGYRRRAVSMQGMERPNPYQAPSVVGGGNAMMYDDGASVISDSRMTFMDGSVAGRTSQYGLPKYPHQPKMDYRRFCVQRGNADVFLD
ncbi:hypothetical protein IAT38_007417 [Cryptococcus sp. DSM 104549]